MVCIHTADFAGIYTATDSAEFDPPILSGTRAPPGTRWYGPAPRNNAGARFRCKPVSSISGVHRRVLSKAQHAEVQNPDPRVQTGLRIISYRISLNITVLQMQNAIRF